MKRLIRAVQLFGIKECIRRIFYHNGVMMFGERVGADAMGNSYYEVKDPLFQLSGRLRYVEYARRKNTDASLVQPEWYRSPMVIAI
jgi:NADH:ubiquinone oxidoreductase subunit